MTHDIYHEKYHNMAFLQCSEGATVSPSDPPLPQLYLSLSCWSVIHSMLASFIPTYLFRIGDLQNTLPEILSLEHTQKPLDGIINSIGNVVDALEAAVRDPLADVLVTLLHPPPDIGIVDQEALPAEPAAHDQTVVLDAVVVVGGLVVVRRDRAARHDAPELVHVRERRVQKLPAHVVVVDVDAVGRHPLEGRFQVLGLVVEA